MVFGGHRAGSSIGGTISHPSLFAQASRLERHRDGRALVERRDRHERFPRVLSSTRPCAMRPPNRAGKWINISEEAQKCSTPAAPYGLAWTNGYGCNEATG